MPARTSATDRKRDFELAFQGLRKLLTPYDKKLQVVKDAAGAYMSESKSIRYMGKSVMFASIASKSYVSLHLFPVYMFPDLAKNVSPELKKRMQGKTCWNFKTPDAALFAELGGLIDRSYRKFAEFGERDLTRDDMKSFSRSANKKK